MHSLSRKTLFQPFTYLLQKQKQEEADYFISKQLMGCLLLSNISHPDPIPVTIPSRLFQTIFLPKKKKKRMLFNTFNTRKTETGKFRTVIGKTNTKLELIDTKRKKNEGSKAHMLKQNISIYNFHHCVT